MSRCDPGTAFAIVKRGESRINRGVCWPENIDGHEHHIRTKSLEPPRDDYIRARWGAIGAPDTLDAVQRKKLSPKGHPCVQNVQDKGRSIHISCGRVFTFHPDDHSHPGPYLLLFEEYTIRSA
jgi:hypothetical protein